MEETNTKKIKSKERRKYDNRKIMVRVVAGIAVFLMVGATVGSLVYAIMMS